MLGFHIAAEKGVETKTQVRVQSQVCIPHGLNGSVEEKLTDASRMIPRRHGEKRSQGGVPAFSRG